MHVFKYITLIPVVACWGELGHRTVAYLAERHLGPEVRGWVNKTLIGEDISNAAIWPDELRNKEKYHGRYNYSFPWHYYNVNGSYEKGCSLSNFDVPYTCKMNEGCIIEAIANQTGRVQNRTLDNTNRAEALKFVLHFIGDIHQPLHTEFTARGGNEICVRWGDKKQNPWNDTVCASAGFDNLHSVWDAFIPQQIIQQKYNITVPSGKGPDKYLDAARKWSEQLYNAKDAPVECVLDQPEVCAFSWASESNKLVCRTVMPNGPPKLTEDLSQDYYQKNAIVVEAQIRLAGLRLAAWINRMARASGGLAETTTLQFQPELKR